MSGSVGWSISLESVTEKENVCMCECTLAQHEQ